MHTTKMATMLKVSPRVLKHPIWPHLTNLIIHWLSLCGTYDSNISNGMSSQLDSGFDRRLCTSKPATKIRIALLAFEHISFVNSVYSDFGHTSGIHRIRLSQSRKARERSQKGNFEDHVAWSSVCQPQKALVRVHISDKISRALNGLRLRDGGSLSTNSFYFRTVNQRYPVFSAAHMYLYI